MSRHLEIPLRQPIQPWPGIVSRNGYLDPGSGEMSDDSTNVMITRGDVLQKRKGFIRGLDEQFTGPVCGLFKYTDTCGVEHLLVADQETIHIRQPYSIPVFELSDAYPFDAFDEDGFPNTYYWRNTERYNQADSELGIRSGIALSSNPPPGSEFMRWFKEATSASYQVRVEYAFEADSESTQNVCVAIKGVGDLTTGTYLMAQARFNETTNAYSVDLYYVEGGTPTLLLTEGIDGSTTTPTGFLSLEYEKDITISRYRARAKVTPFAGSQSNIYSDLTAIQDATLGQTSAIGIHYTLGTQAFPAILNVDGGPI